MKAQIGLLSLYVKYNYAIMIIAILIQEREIKKQTVLRKGFDKDDGVFVRSLDEALTSFHVEKQAYHGGSFVGNHIHRALKVLFKIKISNYCFINSLKTSVHCAVVSLILQGYMTQVFFSTH